jgi:hypothetical protein
MPILWRGGRSGIRLTRRESRLSAGYENPKMSCVMDCWMVIQVNVFKDGATKASRVWRCFKNDFPSRSTLVLFARKKSAVNRKDRFFGSPRVTISVMNNDLTSRRIRVGLCWRTLRKALSCFFPDIATKLYL